MWVKRRQSSDLNEKFFKGLLVKEEANQAVARWALRHGSADGTSAFWVFFSLFCTQ